MKSPFSVVVIVGCALGCRFSILAVTDESKGPESVSQASPSVAPQAEEKTEIVSTSPSGMVRLERVGEDIWRVSATDAAQRVKLPKVEILGEWGYPDGFDFSPNDEWIFAPYHVGSCLSDAVLYHCTSATKVELFKDFQKLLWRDAAKLKLVKADCNEDCAMTSFAGWSSDSGRLLVGLLCGDKHNLQHCYLYFNTRTKKFETTNYLRKVSAAKSQLLACPEPTDALPPEGDLKSRFEMLDKRLNEIYAAKRAKIEPDRVRNLRESQRAWLKAREKGLQVYLNMASPSERERRQLQFLADVTAARIESLNGSEEEEPFDFWERISEKPNE